ncbi:MAG: CIA30 family protein [Elusimicrobia bacterium]|nr:CIA30 family protein [Elusimicrobiota bacterium]
MKTILNIGHWRQRATTNFFLTFFTLFLILGISNGFLYARAESVENFDDVRGSAFSFKDEKGTLLQVSINEADEVRHNVVNLHYDVVKEGWAGWGLSLKGINLEDYTWLTFYIKGEKGGEDFEIGIKNKANAEKKLLISRFVDVSTEWRKVKIPLKEFEGVDLTSMDNLNLGFNEQSGEGTIVLDDFQFEVPDSSEEGIGLGSMVQVNKVLVDSFERSNPTDVYLVYTGDESSLELNASRIVKEGDFAMDLDYTLSTARGWGSWVSARWQAKEVTLDWRGADAIKMWVKGDGSGNILRFSLIDADGERWNYDDSEILKLSQWDLMEMPIKKFTQEEKWTQKNQALDLDQIRGYEITIISVGGSKSSPGVKTSAGKIQVDYLYVTGEAIAQAWAQPPKIVEKEKIRILRIGNIEFNGQLFTEFLNAPEQKSTVNHFGKLIANGKVGNYSAKFEIAAESQEFGEAARYSIAESTASGSTAVTQSSREMQVNLQGFANNISPYLTQMTVGNLFVDYSPFTFSPVFGFKGLSVEGDLNRINYHAFILKHKFDSFTIGSRAKFYWEGFRFSGITVYYRETAKINDASVLKDGTLQKSKDLQLQEVQNDWVYTLDLDRAFWDDKITFGGTFGYNRYTQRAQVDRTNPFDPVFGNLLDPILQVDGFMGRGRVALNSIYIPGLKINYEIRSVDTNFKPRYRQSPISFDDSESDQKGHNIRAVESWRGLVGSLEYDTIKRNVNDSYFRNRVNYGIGYYGFDKMDIAFSQEIRREEYVYTSNRTSVAYNKNEKVIVSELYIRTQINPKLAFFIKPKREDIEHPGSGKTFVTEALYGKLEYFPMTNLKVLGEFRTAHFGSTDFEPKGFPYDDNFVRGSIEFNF